MQFSGEVPDRCKLQSPPRWGATCLLEMQTWANTKIHKFNIPKPRHNRTRHTYSFAGFHLHRVLRLWIFTQIFNLLYHTTKPKIRISTLSSYHHFRAHHRDKTINEWSLHLSWNWVSLGNLFLVVQIFSLPSFSVSGFPLQDFYRQLYTCAHHLKKSKVWLSFHLFPQVLLKGLL